MGYQKDVPVSTLKSTYEGFSVMPTGTASRLVFVISTSTDAFYLLTAYLLCCWTIVYWNYYAQLCGMWQTDFLNFLCLFMLMFVLIFLGYHSFTMQVSIWDVFLLFYEFLIAILFLLLLEIFMFYYFIGFNVVSCPESPWGEIGSE